MSAGREFFATRTVAEALAEFSPQRRTGVEEVPLDDALGRVPAVPVLAASPLPGFARSTVDGYAVRAADTYGASEGLPSYLEVVGAVRMGAEPDVAVTTGTAVTMPTGGVMPAGADAVVMVEHTAETMPGTVEVTRPVAPGTGMVGADEDVAVGDEMVTAGIALRPHHLGLLAAAGITAVQVRVRPVVAIVSTGDEVVPPTTAVLRPGQVRDATASALAGLVRQAGGEPVAPVIVPDDPAALEAALRDALAIADLVVVSAGSSVGARDETAAVVARLGEVWCHGLAIKPGKPTLLADCGGVPLIGLPGNPLSALVVFRLIGLTLLYRIGGCVDPWPWPVVSASLSCDVASAPGRLDVVQVQLPSGGGGLAVPVFGSSALLTVLTVADGWIVVPEDANGLAAGTEVEVALY